MLWLLIECVSDRVSQDGHAGDNAGAFRRRAGRWRNGAAGGAFAEGIDGGHFVGDGLALVYGVDILIGSRGDARDARERAAVDALKDVIASDRRAIAGRRGPGDDDLVLVGAVNQSLDQRGGRDAHHVGCSKQTPAVHLAGDGREGAEAVGTFRDAVADATIGVADDDAAVLVNGGVVEVEQVAGAVAAAAKAPGADGGVALHGVVRRDVHGGVGRAAVIGVRNIEVPDTRPVRIAAT